MPLDEISCGSIPCSNTIDLATDDIDAAHLPSDILITPRPTQPPHKRPRHSNSTTSTSTSEGAILQSINSVMSSLSDQAQGPSLLKHAIDKLDLYCNTHPLGEDSVGKKYRLKRILGNATTAELFLTFTDEELEQFIVDEL